MRIMHCGVVRRWIVIEELLDEKNLVCLNDGSKTRIDVSTGRESVLDLTLVSSSMAAICDWSVYKDGTVGSDHYPVLCKINISLSQSTEGRGGRWIFEKANWEKLQEESDRYLNQIDYNDDIETLESKIKNGIITAAMKSIPKSKGNVKRKTVPWWDEECKEAVRNRNKAFKIMKRTHNFMHMIKCKYAQAIVRKTIRQRKRTYWRNYCSSIGNTTQIGEVWTMIKKMGGERREWSYPDLSSRNEIAVTNKEKAKMLANTFVNVHSSNNLSEEGKRGREKAKSENVEALTKMGKVEDEQNVLFNMGELNRAMAKTGKTAPGKDDICYSMLKQLSEEGKNKLLMLYNKVWEEGKLPKSWKEAIIVPIRKPGKEAEI